MWRPQDCSHRRLEQDTLRLWAVHPCDRRTPFSRLNLLAWKNSTGVLKQSLK